MRKRERKRERKKEERERERQTERQTEKRERRERCQDAVSKQSDAKVRPQPHACDV